MNKKNNYTKTNTEKNMTLQAWFETVCLYASHFKHGGWDGRFSFPFLRPFPFESWGLNRHTRSGQVEPENI